MQETITQNDLIRYLYKETSSSEANSIRKALSDDDFLLAEFQTLQAGYAMLPKVKFRPSPFVIQHILNFSAAVPVE
jgi:hypothetical protein